MLVNNICYCVQGTGIFSAALSMPPLLGWGVYAYVPGQSICFCKWSSSVSFTFFMVSTCFGIPFSVMTFCYYKILKTVQDSKKKTKGGHGPPKPAPTATNLKPLDKSRIHPEQVSNTEFTCTNSSDESPNGTTITSTSAGIPKKVEVAPKVKASSEEMKLTISFIVVVSMFTVCWFPYCITMFWSIATPGDVPRWADVGSLLLGFSNSFCNPIIYGLTNKKYREAFQSIFVNRFRNN